VKLVLDASAAVKLFREEGETPEMRQIVDLYKKRRVSIYTPSLLFVELANALRYTQGLTVNDVFDALGALKMLRLIVVDVRHVLNRAVELAFEYDVTVYDAVLWLWQSWLREYLSHTTKSSLGSSPPWLRGPANF